MELKLLCCKALGTTISKGILQNAWLGANAWPPGYFVVDLKIKRTFREKSGNFFFPYILEIQIILSLAETLLMGKSVNGWTLNQHNES